MSTKCSRPDSLFQPTLPARGATGRQEWAYFRRNDFNPRSPHGERRQTAQKSADTTHHFNPRSLHGERLYRHGMALQHCIISIHAPCTGSDPAQSVAGRASTFQSTLPARGATAQSIHRSSEPLISIHAPRTGSDMSALPNECRRRISIHAPRTGSDNLQLILQTSRWDFNPRSPHGERHDCYSTGLIAPDFNPRSPHGERRPCTALRRTAAN